MPTPYSWSGVENSDLNVDPITKALIYGKNWTSSTLKFSFPSLNNSVWSDDPAKGYGPPDLSGSTNGWTANEPWIAGYSALVATQQAAVRSALSSWASVSKLTFSEVGDNENVVGDLRFAFASGEIAPTAQAWGHFPDSTAYAGDVWFSSDSTSKTDKNWSKGSYTYSTVIHEIGHALGLKHPFNDIGANTTNLPASLDSLSFTIMSYSAFGGQSNSSFSYEPTTPMIIDIMTIQHLYGANMNYAKGDNVYTFFGDKNYNKTIWDAGGNDTFVYGGHDSGILDLREGYNYGSRLGKDLKVYSEGGNLLRGSVDNVWIAFGAVIENATGGTGNDSIFGNNVVNVLIGREGNDNIVGGKGWDKLYGGDGADRLSGGIGNDLLDGGGGSDKFVFNTALGPSNIDTIVQFSVGADEIQLDNAIFTRLQNGALQAANFVANASGNAVDGNDYIVYETDTGKLFYDADGSGGGAKIQFALIGTTTHPLLSVGDFVVI